MVIIADRWSNPSGGLGQQRFRVWPAGSDSYDHVELTANWDHLDGIIGSPPSGMWPPTEGVNGGIYKLIKDIQDEIDDLPEPPEIPEFPTVAYGTSLPSSPLDGDEAILVNSITTPSWQLRFRYNAGNTTPYKWEHVGGTGPFHEIPQAETFPNTYVGTGFADENYHLATYTNLATVGPSITLPRPGVWEIEFGLAVEGNAVPSGSKYWMSYSIAGSTPLDIDGFPLHVSQQSDGLVGNRVVQRTFTASTTNLVAKYKKFLPHPQDDAKGRNRYFRATPVAVS